MCTNLSYDEPVRPRFALPKHTMRLQGKLGHRTMCVHRPAVSPVVLCRRRARPSRGAFELWPEFNLSPTDDHTVLEKRAKEKRLDGLFSVQILVPNSLFFVGCAHGRTRWSFCCFQLFPLYFTIQNSPHLKTRPKLNRFLRLNWCL